MGFPTGTDGDILDLIFKPTKCRGEEALRKIDEKIRNHEGN
jgi:hypothetical protein